MSASEQEEKNHEGRFLALISGLASSAMQHMGKIVNPLTGEVETNLDASKEVIDMLRMLREKTKGNLAAREERTLNALLSNLQLNYIDEVKAEAAKPKEKAEEKAPEQKEEKAAGKERTQAADAKEAAASPESEKQDEAGKKQGGE